MSIVAIDTGGTFTDIVFERTGALHVLKIPSTPHNPALAVLEGLRQVASIARAASSLIHGSTVATNALLERKGARLALITNRGIEDVIEIGRQNRPELYALTGRRPAPLVERALRFGIGGRLDNTGAEIEPVDDAELVALMQHLRDVDAIALCLLHSYANDAHEQHVAEHIRALGKPLSVSSELLREYREYERTATTVVNAYVAPLMDRYLAQLENDAGVARVRIMGSAGGAVPVSLARREPVQTVLSGPAGGVAGALAAAKGAGFERVLTFDMGGTSTDVSLCPGEPLYTREFSIAGVPVAIPVLDIHTVGAGGGSIAWTDAADALRVGPRSAGAVPGPICYGAGGMQVTVTDANVWLGRLPENAFLGGARALARAAIERALRALAEKLRISMEAAAEGILMVANTTMEGALRVISVERGYDPIDFTLVAFGGAAGLHAADLAARLGIPRILLPEHPGVLSAYGMLASPIRKTASRTVLMRSDSPELQRLDEVFQILETGARREMVEEGVAALEIRISRSVDARYHGQSHELRVDGEDWVNGFHAAHARRYGYADADAAVEAVTLRIDATSSVPVLPAFHVVPSNVASSATRVFYDGSWREARVHARAAVGFSALEGPLVVTEYSATTWTPPGWTIRALASGVLLMERLDAEQG